MIKSLRKIFYRLITWPRRRALHREIDEIVSNSASQEIYRKLYGPASLRSTKRLNRDQLSYFSSNGKRHDPDELLSE
jgi:hypothetical protein